MTRVTKSHTEQEIESSKLWLESSEQWIFVSKQGTGISEKLDKRTMHSR